MAFAAMADVRRQALAAHAALGTARRRARAFAIGRLRQHRAVVEPSPATSDVLVSTSLGDSMKNSGEDPPVRRIANDRVATEVARDEAEEFRRLAEEAREVRDHHREALEAIRQERELHRDTAETARSASEEARIAAETARTSSEEARGATDAARQAVVEAVRTTADALNVSLEQMRVVEEMRRTLRAIQDVNKLGKPS